MYEIDWKRDHGEYPEMDDDTEKLFTSISVLGTLVVIIILLNL